MATARATRMARTGARMLVLPGASSAPKADALAERLRSVLDAGDVAVSRPEKTVCLRVSGLDDCTTEGEVAAAISQATGCPADSIKTTKIRFGPDGSGSTCKLLVGWASAIVDVLPHRAQRCYRCHELGHVAARCTSEKDRSGECYRCGKSGHLVTGPCTAKPHCTVCEAAGRPAGHQLGGRPCGAKKTHQEQGQPESAAAAAVDQTAAGSGEK
ncbi:hypothetical protein K1T71_011025 [Dendrolimus kikuchii]|uniref:Uncharacterized protein n=1 Tax=Dendrolimus kikuchii TaxID=765133 RepID=A0ACC1CQN7_9NEOP|nr:hypothetical protein K1T71_011025 [Dendrolimus kikuchii]